ncbi:lipopolysaccharide-induced tumor necrosis factor-alpha factor homolog [Bufo gargarizans]|uniref:lipopolysaccharide-induced tumor necrosis factor-alpha factor homolog n=1 Tax=Bufo gargarizans TaxID=30331 RepID=UPI001CF477DB|nr:lipopolysaccharide-induced tumor necrosis factor-alpha factor homolog [Bufo gargarizans]
MATLNFKYALREIEGTPEQRETGAEGVYPTPPPYAFGGPQPPGAERAHPVPPPYGFGGPQTPGVGVAHPTAPGVGGLQPTVVMAPVTTVVMATSFADTPASCTCPVCRENILTRIQHTNGLLVWVIFGTMILVGCWLGCCLIPFCMDSCKDVDHYCPKCNHHLSKYKRL